MQVASCLLQAARVPHSNKAGAPNFDKEREHNEKGKRKRTGVLNLSKLQEREASEKENGRSQSRSQARKKNKEKENGRSQSRTVRESWQDN